MPANKTQAEVATHKFLVLFRYLRSYARQIDQHGVKPRQLGVLRYLAEVQTATIGEIQAHLYCSPSTTSSVVSGLEKVGYLTRNRSQEDNRVVLVSLTKAGKEMVAKTPLGGIYLLRRQLNTLPPERLDQIDDVLDELMHLMNIEVVEDGETKFK